MKPALLTLLFILQLTAQILPQPTGQGIRWNTPVSSVLPSGRFIFEPGINNLAVGTSFGVNWGPRWDGWSGPFLIYGGTTYITGVYRSDQGWRFMSGTQFTFPISLNPRSTVRSGFGSIWQLHPTLFAEYGYYTQHHRHSARLGFGVRTIYIWGGDISVEFSRDDPLIQFRITADLLKFLAVLS